MQSSLCDKKLVRINEQQLQQWVRQLVAATHPIVWQGTAFQGTLRGVTLWGGNVGSQYDASHCEPTSSCPGRSHLRSAKSGQLNFPRTKTGYGKRSFAVNGPVVWNSLPTELRSPDISLDVFKAKLKTFLFNCWLSYLPMMLSCSDILHKTVTKLHYKKV